MVTEKEYVQIHQWLKFKYGKASRCELFTCEGKSQIYEWGLKQGCEHAQDRGNYLMICRGCHQKYDVKNKLKGQRLDGRQAVFIDEETHAKIKEKAQKNNRSMAKQLKEDYQLCNK